MTFSFIACPTFSSTPSVALPTTSAGTNARTITRTQHTHSSAAVHCRLSTTPRKPYQTDRAVTPPAQYNRPMSRPASTPLFKVNVRQWLRCEQAHGPFPPVSEPREVACYSKDDDGSVSYGSRHQLRKYVSPPKDSNLNDGFGTFVPKRNDDTKIDTVLKALRAVNPGVLSGQCDVVTYRNNLNKIGKTPLSLDDQWELDCCHVSNDKVVLEIRMSPEQVRDDNHLKSMYQGYRFEAICTNEADKPVNPNGEFCSISKVDLNQHRIIVSSEIDCTLGDPQARPEHVHREYVELKTIKTIKHNGALNSLYRYRYPKFWLQSFLAGVSNIVIGERQPNDRLGDVKTVNTFDLPTEAHHFLAQHSRSWDPAIMVNFIDYILDHIRYACANNRGATIRVAYSPSDSCVRAFVVNDPDYDLPARVEKVLTGQ